jgi:hypothetical protein
LRKEGEIHPLLYSREGNEGKILNLKRDLGRKEIGVIIFL